MNATESQKKEKDLSSSQQAEASSPPTKQLGIVGDHPRVPSRHRPIAGGLSGRIRRESESIAKDCVRTKVEHLLETCEIVDGKFLTQLRAVTGVDIPELQNHTKISLDLLTALESDNFKMLPQDTYVKGILTNYLKFLGVSKPANFVIRYLENVRASGM